MGKLGVVEEMWDTVSGAIVSVEVLARVFYIRYRSEVCDHLLDVGWIIERIE